jgi:hypothetical protein
VAKAPGKAVSDAKIGLSAPGKVMAKFAKAGPAKELGKMLPPATVPTLPIGLRRSIPSSMDKVAEKPFPKV